jgi:myo-inositol-1(or 4)-monophosphatase
VSPEPTLQADWLGACRRAVVGLRQVLDDHPTSRERVRETGTRGEGGDRTLIIDAAVEDIVFGELERLHDQGARFRAVSEERGEVDFGGEDVVVVIDPIDGSLNAKRGMRSVALSIAVADGPTMADVAFGFVHDLGADEEWQAARGRGAFCNGRRLADVPPERRDRRGRLEIVAIEASGPARLARSIDDLERCAYRLRALGSMAVSLCQLADARVDGMLTLTRCRAVDVAAAQLVVRESGGLVAFPTCGDPLGAALDLDPRSPLVAARTHEGLVELAGVAVAAVANETKAA